MAHERFAPCWVRLAGFNLLLIMMVVSAVSDPLLEAELIRQVSAEYGTPAANAVARWQRLMQEQSKEDSLITLKAVNTFFNSIPNVSDADHWGRDNYWATPVELLATNGGDCEDFAIAKYFTLKVLGIAESKLRITYVRAYSRGNGGLKIIPHMVLAYYPMADAEPLILDNIVEDIRPASQRKDLVPTFGFNGEGLWYAKARGSGHRLGGIEGMPLWQDLLTRMGRSMQAGRKVR